VPLDGAANLERLAPLRLLAGADEEMPFVQPLSQGLRRHPQPFALLPGERLRFGIAGLWLQVKSLTINPADAAPLRLAVAAGMWSSTPGDGASAVGLRGLGLLTRGTGEMRSTAGEGR
jgi:hypothetical protein